MTCGFWITVDDGSAESGHPCNRTAVAVYERQRARLPRCARHDGRAVRERAATDGWKRTAVSEVRVAAHA